MQIVSGDDVATRPRRRRRRVPTISPHPQVETDIRPLQRGSEDVSKWRQIFSKRSNLVASVHV